MSQPESARSMATSPYDQFVPLVDRLPIVWPNNYRIALCVLVHLEHFDWIPPASRGLGESCGSLLYPGSYPNIRAYSHREYGKRVGVFRVMESLDKCGIRASLALDAKTAEQCEVVISEAHRRGWEFLCHGHATTRAITSRMRDDEEHHYIKTALATVTRTVGTRPVGWVGPEYSESVRTPELLTAAGIRYTCDWPNDEQPYLIKTHSGHLISLPVLLDLDDVYAHAIRHVPIMRYERLLKEAFDGLYGLGTSGHLLMVSIHPWLIGQPFRIKYFENALQYIVARDSVWKATGREIAEWYWAKRQGSMP